MWSTSSWRLVLPLSTFHISASSNSIFPFLSQFLNLPFFPPSCCLPLFFSLQTVLFIFHSFYLLSFMSFLSLSLPPSPPVLSSCVHFFLPSILHSLSPFFLSSCLLTFHLLILSFSLSIYSFFPSRFRSHCWCPANCV